MSQYLVDVLYPRKLWIINVLWHFDFIIFCAESQEKLIRMQSSLCKRLASIDMKLSKVFELDTAQHQDMFVPISTMSDLMQFNQQLGADREFAERMVSIVALLLLPF